MWFFIDWRLISFLVLFFLIMAAFLALAIQNAMLYRENQALKRRIGELEKPPGISPAPEHPF